MVTQNLPLNDTTASIANFCQSMRNECGSLLETKAPVATVVLDVLEAVGVPRNAIRLILTAEELDAIGFEPRDEHNHFHAKCQLCEEEAQTMAKTRRGWLLLCDDCAAKVKHD